MSYYRDVREYLKTLEENGKLVRVMRAINKDTEMHPLVRLQYRGLPARLQPCRKKTVKPFCLKMSPT